MYRGLCYCFLSYVSYSQLLIRFPRCPKEAKAEILERVKIFQTHIVTFPQGIHRNFTRFSIEW